MPAAVDCAAGNGGGSLVAPAILEVSLRSKTSAQSKCQRRCAPMVFGFIPEYRSASLQNRSSASPAASRAHSFHQEQAGARIPESQARLTKILGDAFVDKPKPKLVALPGAVRLR